MEDLPPSPLTRKDVTNEGVNGQGAGQIDRAVSPQILELEGVNDPDGHESDQEEWITTDGESEEETSTPKACNQEITEEDMKKLRQALSQLESSAERLNQSHERFIMDLKARDQVKKTLFTPEEQEPGENPWKRVHKKSRKN